MLKVMSKMGISTYQSYCGAQIFDAVGLNESFVDRYFTGTPRRSKASAWPRSPPKRARHLAFGNDDPGARQTRWTSAASTPSALRGESMSGRPISVADLQHAVRGNARRSTASSPAR
jgi:glutamate synthase (NADPH/NADH) large chain